MMDSEQREIFHDKNAKQSSQKNKRAKKPPQLVAQDHELLAILPTNEDQYFAEVDTRFRAQLSKYLQRKATAKLGFTHDDIEDLTQITLERFYIWVHNCKKASKPIMVNHQAYLLSIARNVYVDEIKDRIHHPALSLDQPMSNQEQDAKGTLAAPLPDPYGMNEQERKIFLDQVRDTIEQLREPYRTVMRHIAVDDMKEKEIIDHLKVNPNTGKAWIQRGRAMLKKALPEYKDYL